MMQFSGEESPPLGVVFDSDLGNTIDDVLALALLQGFDSMKKPEARLLSVSVTKSNLKAAAFCEVVDRFYSAIANREIPERFRRNRPSPVGFSLAGKMVEDTPILSGPLAMKDDKGEPLYPHEITKPNDTADPAALIRNAFTAQQDQNTVVVLTGPATNLTKVLELHGVRELISQKVKFLSVAAGAYPQGPADFPIRTDIRAAQKLFAEWPTPIFAVSQEVGDQLRYPAASIENDFKWAPHNPIVDAYHAYKPMPYDAPAWAMAAALYAVRPAEGYFLVSEPGMIQVFDDGATKFTPSPDGKHRYLSLDPAKKDLILKTYTEIASAEPAPRELPGFLKKLIEDEKKEDERKQQQQRQQQQQ